MLRGQDEFALLWLQLGFVGLSGEHGSLTSTTLQIRAQLFCFSQDWGGTSKKGTSTASLSQGDSAARGARLSSWCCWSVETGPRGKTRGTVLRRNSGDPGSNLTSASTTCGHGRLAWSLTCLLCKMSNRFLSWKLHWWTLKTVLSDIIQPQKGQCCMIPLLWLPRIVRLRDWMQNGVASFWGVGEWRAVGWWVPSFSLGGWRSFRNGW